MIQIVKANIFAFSKQEDTRNEENNELAKSKVFHRGIRYLFNFFVFLFAEYRNETIDQNKEVFERNL